MDDKQINFSMYNAIKVQTKLTNAFKLKQLYQHFIILLQFGNKS